MRNIFRSFLALLILVGIAYVVTNYAGQVQQKIGVKGASTSRAQGIEGQISHDVGSQINSAEAQAMHVNVSDVLNGLSHFKEIPQAANSIKSYAQSTLSNVLQSRNKK